VDGVAAETRVFQAAARLIYAVYVNVNYPPVEIAIAVNKGGLLSDG
jgi:hypothetical protein